VNNLAASYAQHPPTEVMSLAKATATSKPDSPSQAPALKPAQLRLEHLDSAKRWATNAYEHSIGAVGDKRTIECDEACAAALCNLGDIASLTGDLKEARKRYTEGLEMSKKFGFQPGIQQAQAALQKLST